MDNKLFNRSSKEEEKYLKKLKLHGNTSAFFCDNKNNIKSRYFNNIKIKMIIKIYIKV